MFALNISSHDISCLHRTFPVMILKKIYTYWSLSFTRAVCYPFRGRAIQGSNPATCGCVFAVASLRTKRAAGTQKEKLPIMPFFLRHFCCQVFALGFCSNTYAKKLTAERRDINHFRSQIYLPLAACMLIKMSPNQYLCMFIQVSYGSMYFCLFAINLINIRACGVTTTIRWCPSTGLLCFHA